MSPHPRPTYPNYALSERIADGVIHAIGILFAVIGTTFLVLLATGHDSPEVLVGVSVYGGAIIASFLASAAYHMTPWQDARPMLRRIDQAAIYFKIAGTYTPLVILIGSAFAYAVLGIVWALALAGAVAKLFLRAQTGKTVPVVYLALGWASLALLWPLARALPVPATILVVSGGCLYTLGVIFFTWEGLKYSNAIWHGFVLAASACFFSAIVLGTLAQVQAA